MADYEMVTYDDGKYYPIKKVRAVVYHPPTEKFIMGASGGYVVFTNKGGWINRQQCIAILRFIVANRASISEGESRTISRTRSYTALLGILRKYRPRTRATAASAESRDEYNYSRALYEKFYVIKRHVLGCFGVDSVRAMINKIIKMGLGDSLVEHLKDELGEERVQFDEKKIRIYADGNFNFIGGSINPRDDKLDTMIREFQEETGVTTSIEFEGRGYLFVEESEWEEAHFVQIYFGTISSFVVFPEPGEGRDAELFGLDLYDPITIKDKLTWSAKEIIRILATDRFFKERHADIADKLKGIHDNIASTITHTGGSMEQQYIDIKDLYLTLSELF